ncbi:MAG: hypothetical protein AAF598_02495 [Bacteroidota bacterium]
MRGLYIFRYEWKHFSRSPFKVVALLLFMAAAIYGLHTGANLYHQQTNEIERILSKTELDRQEYINYYEQGEKGPKERPWIDVRVPFWAIWYNNVYHFKTPSPALVYAIGQTEQYGFYKRVTFMASPYDADMTNEITNPERLQSGTLDFTFSILYLLPLLLLILVYNIKSAETEQGIFPLIEVQVASSATWLFSRMAFYSSLLFLSLLALLVYGALLTDPAVVADSAFRQMLLFAGLYLIFWSVIFYVIIWSGQKIIGNTLKMVGIWMFFAFIVPASVQQWISIQRPTNLMTAFIDATREERQSIYNLPDSTIQEMLHELFPEIQESSLAKKGTNNLDAMNRSVYGLVSERLKQGIALIEADNDIKNKMIQSSFWYNPIAFFQNRFNRISESHYDDYKDYRSEIQRLIDKQIRIMVLDTWNEVTVDKTKFTQYQLDLKTL